MHSSREHSSIFWLITSTLLSLKHLSGMFLLVILLGLPLDSLAQQVEFSSSMNPVGSGARATGMGGAFIAVADDATAASWNPAGLIHLEKPEVSFVYSYSNRGQSYNSSTHPELEGTTHETNLNDINFASLAVPFVLLDHNMVVSINYQRLYDMNKKSSIDYLWDLQDGDFMRDHINFTQKGYLGAISPAIAVQILPQLYLGVTFNFWDDFAGTCNWENNYTSSGNGSVSTLPFTQNIKWTNKYKCAGTKPFSKVTITPFGPEFKGTNFNYNLGLLYNINGKFSVGVVYKTAFETLVNKETSFSVDQKFPDFPAADSSSTDTSKEKIKISMPASYGVGFAYRHSDSLSLALDVYRTQWSKFVISDEKDNKSNPISGAPISDGKPHDTTQVRLGGEYLFIGNKTVVPLRAGIFYDPEPGSRQVDDFYGFSVGSGIAYDQYTFDFSYQYRWGNRVTGDIPQPGTNSDIQQHTVMTSLIYHF
ncbi:MAG: outer membrane protein transport protein [Geobacteraceae bacterium]|nr:outer membrane protein transport protein [Geobacteraceae bacterium]